MLTSFIISAITCIALDWLQLHPVPPRPPTAAQALTRDLRSENISHGETK